jgi:hypothetical protein
VSVTKFYAGGYAQPYAADSRPVWLVGLSFDSKTRHLVDFAAVALTTNFKGDKP